MREKERKRDRDYFFFFFLPSSQPSDKDLKNVCAGSREMKDVIA